ncbi:MAG: hypothetical protein ACRCZJ_02700 [Erysipelotrichaceae bacterium]
MKKFIGILSAFFLFSTANVGAYGQNFVTGSNLDEKATALAIVEHIEEATNLDLVTAEKEATKVKNSNKKGWDSFVAELMKETQKLGISIEVVIEETNEIIDLVVREAQAEATFTNKDKKTAKEMETAFYYLGQSVINTAANHGYEVICTYTEYTIGNFSAWIDPLVVIS